MILNLVGALNDKEKRFGAAVRLAEYFNCSYLMIFIPDPEIGEFLPAPGFPQTLPDGKTWNSFINECLNKGYHTGTLPFPDANSKLAASGISGSENSVIILLGGVPEADALKPLKDILPVLIELFKLEQKSISSEIRVSLADKSAAKAEKLAQTIDVMRIHLKDALIIQKKDKKAIEDLMIKKDEFMNVASHELKTPITNMKAYLQILERKLQKENSSGIEFINKANNQIDKLTSLVNDLLDVTKIQAGKMVYHFTDLDISTVISEVVSEAQVSVQTHQIIIKNNVHALVHGEKNRLEQVISNFLSNAIKYSPHADKIIVDTNLIDNKIRISIKDFGIGIPGDKQKQVFDRFFRVDESSHQFSGLGLGLFISAEIVRRHGGNIGVDSDDNGSEFYFCLPTLLS
jgi:signal transduction histidine kinase